MPISLTPIEITDERFAKRTALHAQQGSLKDRSLRELALAESACRLADALERVAEHVGFDIGPILDDLQIEDIAEQYMEYIGEAPDGIEDWDVRKLTRKERKARIEARRTRKKS